MRGDPEARLERSREVADRHAALLGDPRQENAAVEVFAEQFGRPALLPGRKAAYGDLRKTSKATIGLQQMGTEHQTQLIERKRAGPCCRFDRGKKHPCDLGNYQVILTDAKFIVFDWPYIMSVRNFIKS